VLGLGFLTPAQVPTGWTVDEHQFEFVMTITGVLELNRVVCDDSLHTLAAFVEAGETLSCRGVAQPLKQLDHWYFFLMVYGNQPNEPVFFQYYDAVNDTVLGVRDTVIFTSNGGDEWSVTNPFVFHGIPINEAPVAAGQTLQTNEDNPVAISLTATDPNPDDILTYEVVTSPKHGLLSGLAPELVYTPSLNFNGKDSLAFRAQDWQTASAIAWIRITVAPVNDAPQSFSLSTPATNTTIYVNITNLIDTLTFSWNAALDVDAGDVVTYIVQASDDINFLEQGSIEQTTLKIPYLLIFGQVSGSSVLSGNWNIKATDGKAETPAANGPFNLTINVTKVGIATKPDLPKRFELQPNFPNPFNVQTSICYALPHEVQVRLTIFTLTGQPVVELVNAYQPAGFYTVSWNAASVSSGMYLYRLEAGSYRQIRKCILLK
jgi:hypothetical protein